MAGDRRISLVLPAYNEEANVTEAIRRARSVAHRLCSAYEIVVVDDGSTDGTAACVEAMTEGHSDLVLLRHPRNRGYGEALRTGFRAARHELVFFTDSDNQFDLDELELFLPWIDRCDVVCGYRINRRDRWSRRVIGKSWNYLVRALFYVPVRDIDCAFKLFRRSVLTDLLRELGGVVPKRDYRQSTYYDELQSLKREWADYIGQMQTSDHRPMTLSRLPTRSRHGMKFNRLNLSMVSVAAKGCRTTARALSVGK